MDQDNQNEYNANLIVENRSDYEDADKETQESVNFTSNQQPEKVQQSNMSLASLIMGIIGLVTSCCCGGVVCGSLGIIFALLSKTEKKFEKYAKVGLITSIISFVISMIAIVIFIAWAIKEGEF